MTINYTNNTIEMTKNEAKAAGKYGSDKFNELHTLKAAEPTFRVVIVKSAAKRGDHFKGLTFEYMETYIKAHDTDCSIMAEFYELRGLDTEGNKVELAAAASYGEIKMWFLSQYPEIEAMSAKVNKIIDNARRARTAQKTAA